MREKSEKDAWTMEEWKSKQRTICGATEEMERIIRNNEEAA